MDSFESLEPEDMPTMFFFRRARLAALDLSSSAMSSAPSTTAA